MLPQIPVSQRGNLWEEDRVTDMTRLLIGDPKLIVKKAERKIDDSNRRACSSSGTPTSQVNAEAESPTTGSSDTEGEDIW